MFGHILVLVFRCMKGTLKEQQTKRKRYFICSRLLFRIAEIQRTCVFIWQGITLTTVNIEESKTSRGAVKTVQPNLPLFSKYANSSSKALDINKAVENFIVSDMRPLSIVDNLEFKVLLQKLDPLYVADKIIPEIYNDKKEDIKQKLAKLHQWHWQHVLKPLKTATTIMYDQHFPTVSMIFPLRLQILDSMVEKANG